MAYTELLRSHQLFALAAEVMSQCDAEMHQDLEGLTTTTKNSTFIRLSTKPAREANAAERRAALRAGNCAVCHLPTRGLFVWCQGCGHGGHAEHLRDWFAENIECPAGCGHRCQLRPAVGAFCVRVSGGE